MRVARTGAVLVATLLLSGCGGGSHRRAAVNAYLVQVSRAQVGLAAQTSKINKVYRAFSMRANSPKEVRALVRARTQIVAARRRVMRIQPPHEARLLHEELLQLLDHEAAIAADLIRTARYLPQLARAVAPLRPAGVALPRDLRGAKHWLQQAAAFARYRAALEPVLAVLTQLRAPAALRPSLVGERALIRDSIRLSGEIERALRHRDGRTASAKVHALSTLASGSQAAVAQRGQRAAARAYNARIAALWKLAGKIARERLRLERTLR
jgi:hypothetical protein